MAVDRLADVEEPGSRFQYCPYTADPAKMPFEAMWAVLQSKSNVPLQATPGEGGPLNCTGERPIGDARHRVDPSNGFSAEPMLQIRSPGRFEATNFAFKCNVLAERLGTPVATIRVGQAPSAEDSRQYS